MSRVSWSQRRSGNLKTARAKIAGLPAGCYGTANRNSSFPIGSRVLAFFLGHRLRLIMAIVEAVRLVGRRRAVAGRRFGQRRASRFAKEFRPLHRLVLGEGAAQS